VQRRPQTGREGAAGRSYLAVAIAAALAIAGALAVWRARAGEGGPSGESTAAGGAAAGHAAGGAGSRASTARRDAAGPAADLPSLPPAAPLADLTDALAREGAADRCAALGDLVAELPDDDVADVIVSPAPAISAAPDTLLELRAGEVPILVPAADYELLVLGVAPRLTLGMRGDGVTAMLGPAIVEGEVSGLPGLPPVTAIDLFHEAFAARRADYRCDPAAPEDASRLAVALAFKSILFSPPGKGGEVRAHAASDPDRAVLVRDEPGTRTVQTQWRDGGRGWTLTLIARGQRHRDAALAAALHLGAGRAAPAALSDAARAIAGDRDAAARLLAGTALAPSGRRALEEWLAGPGPVD